MTTGPPQPPTSRAKRDELNALVNALHRRHENGMSAYEAFGRVIADRDLLPED